MDANNLTSIASNWPVAGAWQAQATWATIDCEEQWRVARKRKAVASESEEPG